MGLQLPGGSVDDQIELGDLLDERDLILACEKIGLELLLIRIALCAGCCRRGHGSTG